MTPDELIQEAHLTRSPEWPSLRRAHLAAHPTCAACGTATHLEVHHEKPVHLWPEYELNPANLITLCESSTHNCHLIFGHLLDWSAYNRQVEQDTADYLSNVKSRPTKRPEPAP